MAAPAWATDLTDIDLDPSGIGSYAAIGGGGAGLQAETDYFVQGGGTPTCLSKDAFTNTTKGMCNDTDGIPWTVPTDGVLLLWGYFSSPTSLDSKANGGLRLIAGDSNTVYHSYYVGGNDTLIFETFVPYVVAPDSATADATAGTPSGTWSAFGLVASLPSTSGPSKGAPIAIDALRFGRHTLEYTEGDGSPNFNTFVLAEATANSLANRWGNIEFNKGAYFVQGFHSFGVSGTAVDFRDSDKVIFIRDNGRNNLSNDAVTVGYNRFEIINSGSNVEWTNILFQSLGTQSPGTFIHTAGTLVALGCQFVNVGAFALLSTSVLPGCTFRNTGVITAPGSDLQDSLVTAYEGAVDTSVVVWDVATDPNANMDSMTYEMGTTLTHAIEFGLTSPLTMTLTDCVFTGYNQTTDDVNDSTFHVKRTSGTVTINIVGTGTSAADLTARSDGATVVIVGSVNLKVTVKDVLGVAIQDAQTAIFDSSDVQLMNEDTTAGGIAEEGYSGSTPEDVTVRVRKGSTGATKYLPVASPQTITSSGLDVTITLIEDPTNAT